jgi:hypothetical protein
MHMQAQENPEQDAPKPEAPKHVILFNYNPQLKAMVRYDALVIGTRDFDDHDQPVLNLVHFRHDDVTSHHALNGVDWADTLDRTLDVPHQCDRENQSFYYLCEGEENPVPSAPPVPAEPVDEVPDGSTPNTTPGPTLVATPEPSPSFE